jgi:predicted PurR-regulated permease PerM
MISFAQIRQILLLLLISALFVLIFWNLYSFISALLGAYTLYLLLQKPMTYLIERHKWPIKWAAALLLVVSFLGLLMPMTMLLQMLRIELMSGIENADQIAQNFQNIVQQMEAKIGFQVITSERLKSISAWLIQEGSLILNATLSGLLMLLITYFILWFMLTETKKMEHSFFNWMPLKDENIKYFKDELNKLVYSNALGIPLMGIVQGTAGLIGYTLAGVEDIWFWVFLTFIAGMIPFLGVMLAFIPLAVVLFSKGMVNQAIFIFVYGMVVIGSVDNLARMWFLKKIGHTHPLITLFGVIMGLKLFGFVGFIFGPITIAMFFLMTKIYIKEFK